MKKNKIFITIASSIFMASCAFGVMALDASAATATPSFALKDGASIRVTAPAGIRFETKILRTEYADMVAKNAEYGTLVIPEEMLGENELTVSVGEDGKLTAAENVLIIKADNIKAPETDDVNTEEDDTLYNYYNAVIVGEKNGEEYTGLPEEFYGVNFVARSYVIYDGENGKVVEYATNTPSRSIATVAKSAILDTQKTYKDEEYAYFHDITDYVAKEETLLNVKVNKADTLACEVDLTDDEVKAVYVFGTDEQVASTSWSYAENKFAFTQDYLAALENGEYTYKLFTESSIYSLAVKVVEEYAATPEIEEGYNFETNAKLSDMVSSGVLNANMSGAISRVSYADEGITVADTANKYGVKIVADEGKSTLVFRINFGKQLSAGDKISFNIYVKQPDSVTSASSLMRLSGKSEYTATTATRGGNMTRVYSGASTSFKYETWLTCTFTLTQVNENNPNGIWVGMEYPSGITTYSGVIAYIDNVSFEEGIVATPAIEDGYNFETNAVLSEMVSGGVLNATTQSGTISRVSYEDEGITVATGNKYGVKIVADANKSTLVFRINFGKQLSAGDKISFNIYVKTPTSVTDATKLMRLNGKSEYTATTATRGGNMTRVYSGASTSFKYETWLTCTFTLTQVTSSDPNGIWVGMEYPSGITIYSGVIAYIDNITLTQA